MRISPEQKLLFTNRLKKYLKVAAVALSILLLLQVVVYFGSNFLLRGYIQQQVENVSDGKYKVDFEEFHLSLFERGFYINGFTLDPVDPVLFEKEDIPFYRVSTPEFSIKKIGFSFKNRILTIGEIRLQKPVVESRQSTDELEITSETTPLRQLEIEVQRSLGENLKDIVIKEIFIDNADLLLVNFISQKSIKADETNLYVRNLKLAQTAQPIPFNADGFVFDLKNFEILLADSIHTVSATAVSISSLDNRITAERVIISPDFDKPSDTYYEIELDNLELTDADIDQMFYTSDVGIGTLKLEGPTFTLYTDRINSGEVKSDTQLYELIEDILASISINNLNIRSGNFLQRGISDPNKNRIEAEDIWFKMQRVYIGPDELRRQNQFFYAGDAELDISKVRLALADGIHWVSGENMYISSISDKVSMEKIQLTGIYDENNIPDITLFEIEVPYLNFTKANLRKIYNENIVDIEEMTITSPDVILKDLQGSGAKSSGNPLRDLTKDFLTGVYVKRLEITEGSLILDNHIRVRQDSLSFGKINLVLENFQLDETIITEQTDKIFFADDLRLEIEDYALKLSDNLHLFSSDRILIDTQLDLIDIEGFHLKPSATNDVIGLLSRYGRTTMLDIEIPRFTAKGVDINKAYFDEELLVKHIDIPSPVIQWIKYIQKSDEEEDTESVKMERADILNLLTAYFNTVKVDSLTLEDGSFIYDNFANENFRSFAENDISISIKNFYLDENVDLLDSRTLFSEEVDVNLNNYVFNIADGKYTVVADRIAFNSAKEEISTFNVRLRPQRDIDSKVSISATIPNMSITGVDLEAFLFENTLALDKLSLSEADVNLIINREVDEDNEGERTVRRSTRNLPKTIDIVKVDEINAENAKLNISYDEEGKNIELIKTGLNLTLFGFMLDSAKLAQGDIAAFFNNMAMDVDNFTLALRDSIHTVNFSKIELNTQGDEITLENLNIIPQSLIGNIGIPIIAASIPKVTIRTQSLKSFQRTGDLDITSIIFTNPDVTLYLDRNEVTSIVKPEEAEEKLRQKIIEVLNIDSFEILGGKLSIREKNSNESLNSFGNISILLKDLNFNLTEQQTIDSKFLLNNDYQFELTDYEIKLPDSLNLIYIGKILLSEKQLELQDFSYMPRYGKFEYSRKVGLSVDVAELQVEKILLDEFNLDEFINHKKIIANSMQVFNPKAVIFKDKRMPPKEEVLKKMPQELLIEISSEVNIGHIEVFNGNIQYEEFPEKGMIPGLIEFANLNATLDPFILANGDMENNKMHLNGSLLLNGQAQLNVNSVFGFKAPYPIHVEASIGEFELSLINSILESNAFVTVESGIIRGGEWNFTADDNHAIGSMSLRYNDLKVRLLDERTLEHGTGRKKILTFVVNALALRSNNPRKLFNRLITSTIYEPRDKTKFVFNYLWKATFSGLMGSSGISQPKIPRKEEEESQEP
ncbi:hypothetical protein [Lunatibacter salilacus]|uniref:hypothetical protein n=1 Tax=Lunatibacter salilacus TaxID=2483804 RepID=UPI00131E20FE|nr:hypothetical protein [Lunatibacter salilacus]